MLLIALFLGSALSVTSLPSFEWEKERYSSTGVPLLSIRFPSGEKDHAVLHLANPIPQLENEALVDIDNCIFSGYLHNEPDARVTVTNGCPYDNSFEITLNTDRLEGSSFKVDNGNVEEIDIGTKDSDLDFDQVIPPISTISAPVSRAALPPTGFIAKVKVVYDANFKKKWGDDSVNAMRRIMALAQDVFRWKTLTTTVRLNIVTVEETPVTFTGGSTGPNLNMATDFNDPDVNLNLYITFNNNIIGPSSGRTYLGEACGDSKHRAAIIEYLFSDARCSSTVAHEIGHLLGMRHDFLRPTNQARIDSSGKSCKDIGGVMDYAYPRQGWSPCSVADFTAYYNKYQPFCLAVDNGSLSTIIPPSTTVDPCPLTLPSECDDICSKANYSSSANCPVTLPSGKVVQCSCS